MSSNDTRTAKERAEELAKARYVDGRRGAIWDGLSTMVQTAKEGYVAGFLARDAEPTMTAEQIEAAEKRGAVNALKATAKHFDQSFNGFKPGMPRTEVVEAELYRLAQIEEEAS